MALARHVTLVHQNEGLEKSNNNNIPNVIENDDESEDDDDAEMGIASQTMDQSNNNEEEAKTDEGPVSAEVLREYICRARRHQPVVPPEVSPYIVEAYVTLRQEDNKGGRGSKANDQTAMTARQLLSILRLSQALARLRFSDLVARQDADEAMRLTHMSKASLEDYGNSGRGADGRPSFREDVTSRIFQLLREYLAATVTGADDDDDQRSIDLRTAEAMALRKGFTAQQFQACLEEYEALRVIQINQTRTHIYFL